MVLDKVKLALSDVLQQPEMYYSYGGVGTSGHNQRYFEGMGNRNIEQSAKLLEMSIKEKEKLNSFSNDKKFLTELNKYAMSVRSNSGNFAGQNY
jgi:restriction endonuclease